VCVCADVCVGGWVSVCARCVVTVCVTVCQGAKTEHGHFASHTPTHLLAQRRGFHDLRHGSAQRGSAPGAAHSGTQSAEQAQTRGPNKTQARLGTTQRSTAPQKPPQPLTRFSCPHRAPSTALHAHNAHLCCESDAHEQRTESQEVCPARMVRVVALIHVILVKSFIVDSSIRLFWALSICRGLSDSKLRRLSMQCSRRANL
jgi:hypothetical protein